MRLTTARLLAALLGILPALNAKAAAPVIEPGLWEIRITTRAGTDPRNTLPERTARRCYTPAEAEDYRQVLPTQINGEQCRLLEARRDGNRATYRLQCDRNQLLSAGDLQFRGSRFEGIVVTEQFGATVGAARIEQRVQAQRVGSCAK